MRHVAKYPTSHSRLEAPLEIVRDTQVLRRMTMAWRAQRLRVAMVPTMGALHEGHMALVRLALEHADRVLVSVFVNPTQFTPSDDYDTYPRTEQEDAARLAAAGANVMYVPSVEDMYPPGFATHVSVDGVARGLCGDRRPGHFRGVATVVTKLLIRVMPDVAVFGEKDYQQLLVIRRLAADLDIPAHIMPCPTERDENGLALSSRNAYLSAEERQIAPLFYQALVSTAKCMETGGNLQACIDTGKIRLAEAGFTAVDYLELRDAETFAPLSAIDTSRPARLLGAVFLGSTRLIDNVTVPFVDPV